MDNMFNINPTTEETTSTGGNYIIVNSEEDFIQENVFGKEIVLGDDEKYYEIICEKDGKELKTQRQYFPDRERSASEEKFNKAVEIKRGLLTNFIRKYFGDQVVIAATSWQDLVRKSQQQCAPKFKTTPLRVKLELVESNSDGKIYTNIATFGPFEKMSDPCKLRVTDKDKEMLRKKNSADTVNPSTDGESGAVDTSAVPEF